jgi:hypothetical protein
LALTAAAACSHLPNLPSVTPPHDAISVTPDLPPRERVRVAVELMGHGEALRAEAELQAALAEQPNLRSAQRLLEQINGDPATLLRGEARPYTVRQGETMSMLAERFQGDALLFYALARYNDLDAPNEVAAGQTLMIPRRPGLQIASAPELRGETPMPPLPPAPTQASAPGIDPARANQLRLQGLQYLNAGQVDRAVALLRQAQGLDAGNAAIQRDLDRALRLQASLGASGGGVH